MRCLHATLPLHQLQPALDMDRLATLGAPALLLSGERTPPIHHVVYRALAKAMPYAGSRKVAGAGHGVARDAPDAFNALALDFLARHGFKP